MAHQVLITFGKYTAPGRYGAAQVHETGGQAEEIISSGTSQATTMTANQGDVCTIVNTASGLLWVAFGESPTAAVGTLHPVPGNSTRTFGPVGAGHKVAIIDDS